MNICGYAATAPKLKLTGIDYDATMQPHEVAIKITHCGICHSDIHLIDNDWGMSNYPFIPGHEIVGVVEQLGADVTGLKVGQRVGVGWQCGSCHVCDFCEAADEKNCPQQQATCVGRNGGFATGIVVDAAFAVPVPDGLASESAAPMMCGGITSYTPVRDHVKKGMKVGVIGIGGLGHYAVLWAAAKGAEVTAISRSPEKEELVKNLGATSLRDMSAISDGEFDVIINTAPANLQWDVVMAKLKPRGVLVQVGAAPEPMQMQAFSVIAADKSVVGSHIGNPDVIAEMLQFAADNDLNSVIEEFDLEDVNAALDKVRTGDVQFRAVLRVN